MSKKRYSAHETIAALKAAHEANLIALTEDCRNEIERVHALLGDQIAALEARISAQETEASSLRKQPESSRTHSPGVSTNASDARRAAEKDMEAVKAQLKSLRVVGDKRDRVIDLTEGQQISGSAPRVVNIFVVSYHGQERYQRVHYRISAACKLNILFNTHAALLHCSRVELRFYFDGVYLTVFDEGWVSEADRIANFSWFADAFLIDGELGTC